jgi:hypothetical protein
MFQRLAPLIAAATCLLSSGGLQAASYEVAGRSVAVELPPDYCAIDKDIRAERELHEVIQQINAGMNRVLVVFVDCQELRSWRRGEIEALTRYGQVLTPARETVFDDLDLSAFLGKLRKVMDQAFAAGLQDGRSRALAVMPDLEVGEVRSLGVLAQDEMAIYAGMAELLERGGTRLVMAGVVSMTLLNQVAVSVNLYRPYRDPASVETLLAEQKRLVQELLRRNGTLESRRPAPPPDQADPG